MRSSEKSRQIRLTHYTRDLEGLRGILVNGFAWVPNRRHLIQRFVPEHDWSHLEPQQFGMISFTQLNPRKASKHRERFGQYGIVMAANWASRHDARPVVYVPERGIRFLILRMAFRLGYQEAKQRVRFPQDMMWNMIYINKGPALLAGAKVWAALLGAYEYMEPKKNAYQREWRMVHKMPSFDYKRTTREVIENVSPPKGWDKYLRVVALTPDDVAGFVCPAGSEQKLRGALPNGFQEHDVETFDLRNAKRFLSLSGFVGK